MQHKVIISVVIPVYNCEKYLSECIESILSQSFKNFELILINDGSKDNSLKICNFYKKNDSRIKVINQINCGASQTRKNGLDIAIGKYITFIDSDDYVKKDYLETLYVNLIESEADFICCNSIEMGLELQANNCILDSKLITDKNRLLDDYFSGKRYAYCIWGKLFKKELFYSIDFPNLKYAEDTCIILSLFIKVKKIFLLNYSGYYYRCHENGITMTINSLRQSQDLVFRSNLVYSICKNQSEELSKKAQSEFINSLYRLMVSSCLYCNKIEFMNIYCEYQNVYCMIDSFKVDLLKDKIKKFILSIFLKQENIIRFLIKIIYFNKILCNK